ncbi:unnamed protein product [Schistosoma rodhaini]|uniref:Phosphodiesterase n=2 Tax=Schistosoma rodhaini TaxID=6188 RepID=A0AA85FBJ8_9TREM|nr:unnamed protein product [Schistosoma rodhaini]
MLKNQLIYISYSVQTASQYIRVDFNRMFKRLIRCHVKSSRTPPNKDGTNNKIHLPTKCTTWLFSTISSSSKISTTSDIEANKSTETCLIDNSSKTNNCNETCILINTQHPNDSQRISCNPYCPDPEGIKLPFIHFTKVRNQFLAIRSQSISSSIKEQLKSHSFNNWLYSDAELINFVKFMFVDLNLPELCHFSIDTLENWIFSTYLRYNNVPFHNFKHAFMVTQMMYCIIKMVNLPLYLSSVDLLILLFSALSHDLDHPGVTNSYQINAGTWLALRYNDISPLENHHCMTAFDLITNNPTTNIISGLTPNESRHFRRSVIRCILSTDMAIHSECLSQFQVLRKQVYLNCQSLSIDMSSSSISSIKHNHQNIDHSCCINNNQQGELKNPDSIFPSLQLSSSYIGYSSPSPTQQQPTLTTSHDHYHRHQVNHNDNDETGVDRQNRSDKYEQYNSCINQHVDNNNNVVNFGGDNDSDHNGDNINNNDYSHINASLIQSSLISLINQQPEYLLRLLMILLKVCDISNEIRSPLVADAWVDCLFNEFFLQAAAEKQAGLPVAPHMDPDLVVKSNSQLNFLHNILIPLVKELTYIFRELHVLLESAHRRSEHFSQIKQYELAQQVIDSNCCSTIVTTSTSSTLPITAITSTSECHGMKSNVWATEKNINCVQSSLCPDEITLDANENLMQKQQQPHSRHESPTIHTHTGHLYSPISQSSSSSTLHCKSSHIKVQQSQVPHCHTIRLMYVNHFL